MSKVVLTLMVGVFIGAFTAELLGRSGIRLFSQTKDRTKAAARAFREAFAEGYSGSSG